MCLETVFLHAVAAVVVNRHRQKWYWMFGQSKSGRVRMKPPASVVAGADAGAVEQPFGADGWLVVPEQRRVQRNRLGAGVLQVQLK